MNRRQLFGLAGGAAASAVVVGATAPPAQAFLPLLFRMLMGTAAREAWQETKAGQKVKKAVANAKSKRKPSRKLKTRLKRQLQNG
jgi:hypothetical protein